MITRKLELSGIALVVAATLLNCKPSSNTSSELLITNGRIAEPFEYQAVVQLLNADCSGTFINDYQVIAAAHCVRDIPQDDTNGVSLLIDDQVLNSTSFSFDTRYPQQAEVVNRYDLAVINFPKGTAKTWAHFSNTPPNAEEDVVIVGFGSTSALQDNGQRDKRLGFNKIAKTVDGLIYLRGKAESDNADGGQAATASGDSGGPLFRQDQLAGVNSGGGILLSGSKESRFINLRTASSMDFLARHVDLSRLNVLEFGSVFYAPLNLGQKRVRFKVEIPDAEQIEIWVDRYDAEPIVKPTAGSVLFFEYPFNTPGKRTLIARGWKNGEVVALRKLPFVVNTPKEADQAGQDQPQEPTETPPTPEAEDREISDPEVEELIIADSEAAAG